MKALLIVDVQNDFLPGGALAVPEGDKIISIINRLQEKDLFSYIVATKDWHPPAHISFASHHGKKPGESIEVEGLSQELWPDHCVQGTRGADFAPRLQTKKIDQIFFKGADPSIDSYSAFYDNAHLRSTGLGEYLKKLGVEELYLVGVATDYCVKYSVFDAIKLGFKVYVILDGCRGIVPQSGALEEMQSVGATLIDSSQLI